MIDSFHFTYTFPVWVKGLTNLSFQLESKEETSRFTYSFLKSFFFLL